MTLDWESRRNTICKLYLDEKRTLQDVNEVMKAHYNFNASIRSYRVKLREWGALKFPSSSLRPTMDNDEEALAPSSARKRQSACLRREQDQSISSLLPWKSPRWDKEHFRVAQSPEAIEQDPPESSPTPSSIDVLPQHEEFETAYAAYALVELKQQPTGCPRRSPPPISFPVTGPSFTSDACIARNYIPHNDRQPHYTFF